MTNRNIADTLVVSPRTVANHLYRVYAKLNITGRDNLAELLGSA
jgi:DNA-binding CsgD family transcriptional regulator